MSEQPHTDKMTTTDNMNDNTHNERAKQREEQQRQAIEGQRVSQQRGQVPAQMPQQTAAEVAQQRQPDIHAPGQQPQGVVGQQPVPQPQPQIQPRPVAQSARPAAASDVVMQHIEQPKKMIAQLLVKIQEVALQVESSTELAAFMVHIHQAQQALALVHNVQEEGTQ